MNTYHIQKVIAYTTVVQAQTEADALLRSDAKPLGDWVPYHFDKEIELLDSNEELDEY